MIYLAFLFAVVVSLFAYTRILSKKYAIKTMSDEIHFISTSDDIKIAIFRYVPKGEHTHKKPVILCHGLGANMHNFDITGGYSLARHLSEAGYDSWILNLRGANVKGIIEYDNWDFNYDDYLKKDIPAAVKYVLNKTAEDRVYWVGHSMGGMLLHAFLVTGGEQFVKAGVTLGSPAAFNNARSHLVKLIRLRLLLKLTEKLRFDSFAKLISPLTGIFNSSFVKSQMNVKNVDYKIIRTAQYNAITPLSTKLLFQFASWLKQGDIKLSDGTNVTANLDKVSIPMLVISGAEDMIASVKDTVLAYEKFASDDKSYIELSKSDKFSADYGHIDMVFGKNAPKEVYPVIRNWLDSINQPG